MRQSIYKNDHYYIKNYLTHLSIFLVGIMYKYAFNIASSRFLILLEALVVIYVAIFLYISGMRYSKSYVYAFINFKLKEDFKISKPILLEKMEAYSYYQRIFIFMWVIFSYVVMLIILMQNLHISVSATISGLYLIVSIIAAPNLCKYHAKKIQFLKNYTFKMKYYEMNCLKKEMARSSKVVAVKKTKKKLIGWIYLYSIAYMLNAVIWFSSSQNISYVFKVPIVTDIYYFTISMVLILCIFILRYLYAEVTSGSPYLRRMICNLISKKRNSSYHSKIFYGNMSLQ